MYRIAVQKKRLSQTPEGFLDADSCSIGAGHSLGDGPSSLDRCNGGYYNYDISDSTHAKGIQGNDARDHDSSDRGRHANAGGTITLPDFLILQDGSCPFFNFSSIFLDKRQ